MVRRYAALYLKNTIFGICDSLVSTVGLLSGIGASGANRQMIVMAGIIYTCVEAFSMAVGSFLSEQSAQEYLAQRETPIGHPLIGGTVMFTSFVAASFVPLAPYVFLQGTPAITVSIVASIGVLFLVGMMSARLAHISVLKHAVKTALLGAAAIIIGVVIGHWLHIA